MSTEQNTTEQQGDCIHCTTGVMQFIIQRGGDATLQCPNCGKTESVRPMVAAAMARRIRRTYRRKLLAEATAVARELLARQSTMGYDERRAGAISALVSVATVCGDNDVTQLRTLLEQGV